MLQQNWQRKPHFTHLNKSHHRRFVARLCAFQNSKIVCSPSNLPSFQQDSCGWGGCSFCSYGHWPRWSLLSGPSSRKWCQISNSLIRTLGSFIYCSLSCNRLGSLWKNNRWQKTLTPADQLPVVTTYKEQLWPEHWEASWVQAKCLALQPACRSPNPVWWRRWTLEKELCDLHSETLCSLSE